MTGSSARFSTKLAADGLKLSSLRGKAVHEKVRLYARICQALLTAKKQGGDPFAAIEKIVSWVDLSRTVTEAEQLAQPEDLDFLDLISNGFPQMRRYTPAMLDIFESRAALLGNCWRWSICSVR